MVVRNRDAGALTRRDLFRASACAGAAMILPAERPASAQAAQVPPVAASATPETRIHLNQVGYRPQDAKRAVILGTPSDESDAFQIIDDDATPRTRFRGTLAPFTDPSTSASAAVPHQVAEFDAFERPGRYRLRLPDGKLSAPFTIGEDLYSRLIPLTLEFFQVQRCGSSKAALHECCHADDGIAQSGPRAGQQVDVSGGWHDAGDYLKMVETVSFVSAVMLFACERFPRAFATTVRGHRLPPILAHARTGIEWLLKMHPSPEEFYNQVGDESDHEVWRLPSQDCAACNPLWQPRKVFHGVGANLAGRTAAALALASRLYRKHDAAFAARCLQSAQSAFRLGMANPGVVSAEPYDFYPEKTTADDMEWGAVELYRATHRTEYLEHALGYSRLAGTAGDGLSVYNVHALAHHVLYPYVGEADRGRLKDYMVADADLVRRRSESDPYGLGAAYTWGTAEAAIGGALTCLIAAAIGATDPDGALLSAAARQRDYVLGCNPFGHSFVVGAGAHYPLYPHHQIADLKKEELFGAVVGGPADLKSILDEKIDMAGARLYTAPPGLSVDELPPSAGVYEDRTENYVTNEPAIDYTVKFLLLTAFHYPPERGKQGSPAGPLAFV